MAGPPVRTGSRNHGSPPGSSYSWASPGGHNRSRSCQSWSCWMENGAGGGQRWRGEETE